LQGGNELTDRSEIAPGIRWPLRIALLIFSFISQVKNFMS
jgi:hypothetical protein